MPPHVPLVRASGHEEEQLEEALGSGQGAVFFCVFFLSVFAFVSLLVARLDRYKRGLVRFLLGPFRRLQDENEAQEDDNQEKEEDDDNNSNGRGIRCHLLNEQNLRQLNRCNQGRVGLSYYRDYHSRSDLDASLPFGTHDHTVPLDGNDRVLYNVNVVMGCSGLDIVRLGSMRQDMLQNKLDGAVHRLTMTSVVSICAAWLRERLVRQNSLPTDLPGLCVFLARKGCPRGLCCRMLYRAFGQCPRHLLGAVSLQVHDQTLSTFRDIVDCIYDNWGRWVDEAAAEAAAPTPGENEDDADAAPAPVTEPAAAEGAHNGTHDAVEIALGPAQEERKLQTIRPRQVASRPR